MRDALGGPHRKGPLKRSTKSGLCDPPRVLPPRDLGEVSFRPLGDEPRPAEMDLSLAAIDREPVALLDDLPEPPQGLGRALR